MNYEDIARLAVVHGVSSITVPAPAFAGIVTRSGMFAVYISDPPCGCRPRREGVRLTFGCGAIIEVFPDGRSLGAASAADNDSLKLRLAIAKDENEKLRSQIESVRKAVT